MKRSRVIIGGLLAVLGIVLSRGNFMFGQGEQYFLPLYIIGVAIALLGLTVIASGMTKVTVKGVTCPYCFALNPIDASRCKRCSKELGVLNECSKN